MFQDLFKEMHKPKSRLSPREKDFLDKALESFELTYKLPYETVRKLNTMWLRLQRSPNGPTVGSPT